MLFNKILAASTVLLFLAMLGLGFLLKGQYEKTGQLEVQMQSYVQLASSLELRLSDAAKSIEQAQKDQQEFNEKTGAIRSSISAQKRELEAMKGREALVLRKLGLIELRINKSFNKTQNELSCITGETSLCVK